MHFSSRFEVCTNPQDDVPALSNKYTESDRRHTQSGLGLEELPFTRSPELSLPSFPALFKYTAAVAQQCRKSLQNLSKISLTFCPLPNTHHGA